MKLKIRLVRKSTDDDGTGEEFVVWHISRHRQLSNIHVSQKVQGFAINNCIAQDRSRMLYQKPRPSSIPDFLQQLHLSLVLGIEDVGQVAATTVLTVVHGGHEDTGTALESC